MYRYARMKTPIDLREISGVLGPFCTKYGALDVIPLKQIWYTLALVVSVCVLTVEPLCCWLLTIGLSLLSNQRA